MLPEDTSLRFSTSLEGARPASYVRTKMYETRKVKKFVSDRELTSIGESDKFTSARKAS